MATLNLSNFSAGLDTRRSELTSKPGVLETLQNAHINPGGEIEKRKAFVPLYLPSGTFGLQPLINNLEVFSSLTPPPTAVNCNMAISGTALTLSNIAQNTYILPQAGDQFTISNASLATLDGLTATVISVNLVFGVWVIQCTASASLSGSASGSLTWSDWIPTTIVVQQLTSPNTVSPEMTGVISSTLFQNDAFVAAEFADRYTYCFYNGLLVPDFTNGLVTSWQNTINQIAAALATQVNFTGSALNEVTGEIVYTAVATNNTVIITATPNISTGSPFTATVSTVLEPTSTGTISDFPVTGGVASTAAVQAIGSFSILQGTATSGFASGTASINNLNAYNGTPNTADIVTIGSNTYYFATSAYITANPSDPFAVLVGGTTTVSAQNLVKAIMGTGTVGTTYTAAMVVNSQLTATSSTNTLTFTAIASGTSGNSVPTAYIANNHATYTFSGTTLSGGTNSAYISSVNVNGNNILSAQIPWNQTATQTAIDTVTNINANTNSNGGFTATTSAGVITINSPVANAATFNGQAVSVVVVGQLIIQQMSFNISACTAATTVTSITLGAPTSLTITTGTITSAGTNTLTFGQAIASNIIGTGNGFTALAVSIGSGVTTVFVSPLTSSSATTIGTMTVNTGGSGGTFGNSTSPTLVLALSVYSIAGFSPYATKTTIGSGGASTTTKNTFITNPVTALASGGVPPYKYKWTYAGSFTTQLVAQYPTLATTAWLFTAFNNPTTNTTEQWICTVTDNASSTAVSQPVTIIF